MLQSFPAVVTSSGWVIKEAERALLGVNNENTALV